MNAYVDPTTLRFDVAAGARTGIGPEAGVPRHRRQRGALPRVMQAVRWMAEWPRRQAVIAELEQLSDRELADIGVQRGELHRLFRADFARRASA